MKSTEEKTLEKQERGKRASRASDKHSERGDRSAALCWDPSRNSADTACTQFRNTEDREKVDLYVGLDFGTSSAKVAVRSPFLGRGNPTLGRGHVTVVQWPNGRGGRTRLMPTNLSELVPGQSLTVEAKASPADCSLKVDLMNDPDSVEARAMAAAYLAWVLRASRSYILDKKRKTYESYSLRWWLNLGIPAASYDDEQINEGFRIAGKAAWALSLEDQPPTKAEAIATVNQVHAADTQAKPLLDLIEVEVVPEIVAAAARYARSHEKKDGLHFLVDVGASTIDLCGFVLHEREGEDRWELLNALVEPLGVLRLHIGRLDALDAAGFAINPKVPPRDAGPFDRISSRVAYYLADQSAKAPEDALDVDRDYCEQVVVALSKVIGDLKKNRDPQSPHWKEGLLVFVTGGGRALSILRNAIQKAEERIRPMGVNGFHHVRDRTAAIQARLGVAYGLSLHDVGTITPPSRIGDIKPPPPKPPTPRPDYWGGKR